MIGSYVRSGAITVKETMTYSNTSDAFRLNTLQGNNGKEGGTYRPI